MNHEMKRFTDQLKAVLSDYHGETGQGTRTRPDHFLTHIEQIVGEFCEGREGRDDIDPDLALMLALHDEDPLLIEHAKRRYAEAFDVTLSLTYDGDLWRCQVNGGDETVGISPLPVLRMAVRDHVATLPVRKT